MPAAKRYWRSAAELEGAAGFEEFLHREFPDAASEFPHGVSRRGWLQLMGASFALAGVSQAGCRWEKENIFPEATRPMNRIPGVPVKYATAAEISGVGIGLLVTSFDGRPIKVDGNPEHPQSKGASGVYTQASILQMYDPDRSQAPFVKGTEAAQSWGQALTALASIFEARRGAQGAGLRVLAEPSSSPTLAAMRKRLAEALPQSAWFDYEPLARENVRAGSELAFGAPHRTHYNLDRAEVIVCLDADFLRCETIGVKYSRQFAAGRVPSSTGPDARMNRLYVVDSCHSVTGAMADHHLAVRSEQILPLGVALEAAVFDALGADAEKFGPRTAAPSGGFLDQEEVAAYIREMAADLVAHRGRSVVMVGDRQPPVLHALAHRLNAALGNVEASEPTVAYTPEPVEGASNEFTGLKTLVDEMNAGGVDTLVILGGNPVYTAPADLKFGEALEKVKNSIHLSLYRDETSLACTWHLPQAHFLEAWSDVRAYDGMYSAAQPTIEPLYGGRTPAEIVALVLGGDEPTTAEALVRRTFNELAGTDQSEAAWRLTLHDGFWAGSNTPTVTPALKELPPIEINPAVLERELPLDDLEIVFTPSFAVYDGRYANLAWLQELPDFMTKVTWDNVALLSHATAKRLGVRCEGVESSLVTLTLGDAEPVTLPCYVLAGHADDSITVSLGYGRTAAGRVGGSTADKVEPVGKDFYRYRTTGGLDFRRGLAVSVPGPLYHLATTQDHFTIDKIGEEGRAERLPQLVREADLDEYREHPNFAQHMVHMPEPFAIWRQREAAEGEAAGGDATGGGAGSHSAAPAPDAAAAADQGTMEAAHEGRPRAEFDLWKPPAIDVNHKWAMAIDLGKCTGCNACVIACQAENNIPVVGREQVRRGREMQWIRIDRYFEGTLASPRVVHQPVPCMQCENAPCEQVCPVAATVHSNEGLNDMVYNRCVGTRYCSNNCPYKVRRFNYFNFQKKTAQPLNDPKNVVLKMLFNPEVTIRSRGVMEKCTYCVQRIQNGKIAARLANRAIADGEIQTACQVACPSQAITFGDLHDPHSAVAREHASPRSYQLLEELYTQPRTKYLARVRNPNPKLAPAVTADEPADSHEATDAHARTGVGEHEGAQHS